MDLPPLRPTAIPAPGASSQERLAEGRIFQAQVVQLGDGGSLVLAVGRERVAAASQAAFEVGQRLWLRVKGSGSARVFEILGEDPLAAGEPARAPAEDGAHPFRLLADARGLGELLEELSLARPPRSGERALESFAFAPGAGAEALAKSLGESGLLHEARALGQALERLPDSALTTAARELVAHVLSSAKDPASARAELARLLGTWLVRADLPARLAASPLGDARCVPTFRADGDPAAALVARLLSLLDADLGSARVVAASTPAIPDELAAALREGLALARLSPRLARAWLEALLAGDPARSVLDGLLPRPGLAASEPAAVDFKLWLLAALEREGGGPSSPALRSALGSLESEQIATLARSQAGEGTCYAFALRADGAFHDARLVHARDDDESGRPRRAGGRAQRAVLGFELSRTGPVRAEFVLGEQELRVRLDVARESVARSLSAELEELRARLHANGRHVRIDVGVRDPADLRVPGPESDARLANGRNAVDRLA